MAGMREVRPYKKLSDHIRRPMFGSARDRDRYHSAVRAARGTQRVRIAVAPMTSLEVVRDGKTVMLGEGAEVMLTDALAGTTVEVSLQQLLERDAVIERYLPEPPRAA